MLMLRCSICEWRLKIADMTQFDLMEKTELWIHGIKLNSANLNEIATEVASILNLAPESVLVTDYQNEILSIDILRRHVDATQFVGKKDELFRRLANICGVWLSSDASLCSNGMMGWLVADEQEAKNALNRSTAIVNEIKQRIAKRVIVFSTGSEVASRQIEDTNTPMITQRLKREGFSTTHGTTLKDDHVLIAARLKEVSESGGYGLIVTTGGVGAEGKDHTIEAVLSVDPEAATPYICKFEKGTGRHIKDGVRIAVGQCSETVIVALPGPNDEVKDSMNVLMKALKRNLDKKVLAESIAGRLRKRLQEKLSHSPHPVSSES